MVFTSRKTTLIKKHISTNRMKDLLKYTFLLFEKAAPTLKNLWKTQKIGVH